ncbi:hypothetical protein RND81_06G078600 [Saponaria officinalis]|uniref:Pentatricopeptide repeat-containing protein n=1 Tax=Saponaria officinalis TaxID=3572 RepID=A0AAW1K976_SAPOF
MLTTSRTLWSSNRKQSITFLIYSLGTHSILPRNSYHQCRGLHLRRSFGFWKKFDGFESNSCIFRHNSINIYVASLLGGFQILGGFAVLSSFKSSVKSIVTQSCPDKAEPTNEFVNQVVCTIENTSSIREIRNEIGRLCRCESVSAIANLLKLLHIKQIVLKSDALEILLTATSKHNNIELSLQIFKDLLTSSECLSSRSYCNFAKAFTNTDDCELLLNFITEVANGVFHNNVLILNRIIFSFAETRQIKKALHIFEYMKILKCKPDLFTYNTILGILGRAGQLDEMLLEFASMKEANIIPDIVTYNTLLNFMQKFGRFDLCLAFMREMDGKGLVLDLRTYTTLIESFGRSGRMEEALKLFDAMKQGNVRPSVYIYRSLINNLKKMGKLETANSLLNEMNCSLPNLIGPKDFKRKSR